MKSNKYVLVCPAGNLETLKVAVNNGADAVYFGVEGFNARSKAAFTKEEFLDAINYAHMFEVKIYITLNILVKDSEIAKVLEIADFIYLNGADSIIVQDIGLYYILKNRFPSADIHLSTQLGIHNLYGAYVCENILKANHVVLSRETLLEDIKKIKENTHLSLEFFVQGALCVAFSGNCYYSSMMTAGSGNRGKCFQFCRKKYDFIDTEGTVLKSGYLLSPGDVCMIDNISDLINAGVTHFKIEGRNRRSGYVGGATRIYSQALKSIYSSESRRVLKQLFYRGEYNNLYLDGRNDVINPDCNNHIGTEMGEITQIIPGRFNEVYFTSSIEIENGDTIKVFDKYGEVCTTTINDLSKIGYNRYMMTTTNSSLKVGQKLNLICDISLEKQITEEKKSIPVNFTFNAYAGKKASLDVESHDIKFTVYTDDIVDSATNKPVTKESSFAQISKLGDTYFKIIKYEFNSDGVFMPLSVINKLRRDAISILTQSILEKNKPEIKPINYELPVIDKKDNNKMIMAESDDFDHDIDVDKIILSLNEFDDNLKQKIEKINSFNKKAYITLPVMARGEDLDVIDKFIYQFSPKNLGIVTNNLYGLYYISKGYEVVAGEYMNVFNSYSVQFLKNVGVSEVIISPESNLSQINTIINGTVKMYGDMYYMCFAHCPKRTLYHNCNHCNEKFCIKDEKDSIFSIKTLKIKHCYNYLVSNNTLNIIGVVNPDKVYLKLDENNLDKLKNNRKFEGSKNKKFTYGLLYKET